MPIFTIGNQTFPTKKAAAARVAAILRDTRCGVALDGDDLDLVLGTLAIHPGAPEKTAKGVNGVTVRTFEYRPGIVQRCFYIQHLDGTETDFSYRVAMGLAPSGPVVSEAARAAVWPTIVAYKRQRYGTADTIPCDLTGQSVAFADAHVDHAGEWPFSRIVREFVATHGAPALRDEQVRVVFDRPEDTTAFNEFHDAHAVLQIVEKRANIAKGARG